MNAWDPWLGREERRTDQLDAALAARWLATFDRAAPADGTVPQGLHWCLCTPDAPTARLGADGHPRRDADDAGLLPPLPELPRRMWASSALTFCHPLRIGMAIARRSRIAAITAKPGASGQLVFVELEHETRGDGLVALRERQTLVYRQPAPPAPDPGPHPGNAAGASAAGGSAAGFDPAGWDVHRALVPHEALLFRYSALTFNSHRIHYDAPYARHAEGYRGLVVHGPLVASLLLELAAATLGDNALKTFAFRALSPAICGEPLHLVLRRAADRITLAAFAPDGREAARADGTV